MVGIATPRQLSGGRVRLLRVLPLPPAGCGSRESRPPNRSPAQPTSAIQSRAPRTGKGCRVETGDLPLHCQSSADPARARGARACCHSSRPASFPPPFHIPCPPPDHCSTNPYFQTTNERFASGGSQVPSKNLLEREIDKVYLLYIHRLKANWTYSRTTYLV